MITSDLYRSLQRKNTIAKAWRKIRENGFSSNSESTKNEIRNFESDSYRNINSISGRLSSKSFSFAGAVGIPVKREGKDPRPLVLAPIQNRIVQRAILDVLQDQEEIQGLINVFGSYGGIKERRVRDAILDITTAIDEGYIWFARADIKSFFVNIPREYVLERLRLLISDQEFLNLFEKAMETELVNLNELKGDKAYFPLHEIGVAQGCCLSPFVGNVLLNEFDIEFNTRGIKSFRYIDDFILLSKSKKNLEKALDSAINMLSDLNLSIYDPRIKSDKSAMGQVKNDKITFLGIEIKDGLISPSVESCKSLIQKVQYQVNSSINSFDDSEKCYKDGLSLSHTLYRIDNILKGWIRQYSFCNDLDRLKKVNNSIDKLISKYFDVYYKHSRTSKNQFASRSLLGVKYFSEQDWDN